MTDDTILYDLAYGRLSPRDLDGLRGDAWRKDGTAPAHALVSTDWSAEVAAAFSRQRYVAEPPVALVKIESVTDRFGAYRVSESSLVPPGEIWFVVPETTTLPGGYKLPGKVVGKIVNIGSE